MNFPLYNYLSDQQIIRLLLNSGILFQLFREVFCGCCNDFDAVFALSGN